MDTNELSQVIKDHIKTDMEFNNKLVADVSDIKVSIAKIEVHLARNTDSLVEHMKRSDMLEKKLEPVEKHVYYVHGALKLVGFISLLLGIILGLKSLIGL